MFRAFKIIIILAVLINIVNSQNRYESFPTWVKSVPEYGINGIKNTITQKSNLLIISATGIGAFLAYPFDDQFQDFSQREGLLPDKISKYGDLYGGIWSAWLLPTSIIITSQIANESNREMLQKLEYATSALVANGVITVIIKGLVGRERPNGHNKRSMPSGHTSHSFAVAAVANEIYGYKVGIPSYLIAVLVATSRIDDNDHYLSDVIIGAGLGTVIGRGFAKTYQEKKYISNMSINSKGLSIIFNL